MSPLGQSESARQATQTCGVSAVSHFGVGAWQSTSLAQVVCTQVLLVEEQVNPAWHWLLCRHSTQTPGLPPLPGLQCGALGLEAQSVSVVQLVAAGCRQMFCTVSQTCGATQSAVERHATHRPPETRQRGVGFWQPLSAVQACTATQVCEASQTGLLRSRQSLEPRHSTHECNCVSQMGVGLRQSWLVAQPGSATQVWFWQSAPRPQSRAVRQPTQVALLVSQTGVLGCAEQSASRAHVPDKPAWQHPLAQCWPEAQAESSLQAAEPMQKPWLAQRPAMQVCGEGQSVLVEHGCSPRP